MNRHISAGRFVRPFALLFSLMALAAGLTCPGEDDGVAPLDPPVTGGNTPPRVLITSVVTPSGDTLVEQGELVMISFTGEDAEDTATVRIFASSSANPSPAEEIGILNNFPVGPGIGSGAASWNTTNVPLTSYNIFAEINDGTNAPVRVLFVSQLQVVPPGSTPVNSPPQIIVTDPTTNLGLSALNELTVRYQFGDLDSQLLTVTFLLDKDLNPNNDDINNPGDPFDPNSKIIILPDSELLPNDDPNADPDLRSNPRVLDRPPGPGLDTLDYRFQIDPAQIPVRPEPYFIRATITDGVTTRHAYAVGSLTIAAGASGLVKIEEIGFGVAGARFMGFSTTENLGSDLTTVDDIDNDGVSDFMIAGRFASPRGWPQSGAAYLVFGRPKFPFPPDNDTDGIPDGFEEPPNYVDSPYDTINIGRFGGALSINSIGSFFRGALYAMPVPLGFTPVPGFPDGPAADPDNPVRTSAGLMSINRVDMSADGIPDFVFGLPFVSGAIEYHDDDPVDGGCDVSSYDDQFPNNDRCLTAGFGNGTTDDMTPVGDINSMSWQLNAEIVDQGLVCVVDGTNNIQRTTTSFIDVAMAGQNDSDTEKPRNFEGTIINNPPAGMRFRGTHRASPPAENLFGLTVSGLQDENAQPGDPPRRLVISIPSANGDRGFVEIWPGTNYMNAEDYTDGVMSLPSYRPGMPEECTEEPEGMDVETMCIREFVPPPSRGSIAGVQPGDQLGYAAPAGHVNQDGVLDLVLGAPGADRNGLIDNGIMYVVFPSAAGFGNIELSGPPPLPAPPQLRITGTHDGDRFGQVQTAVSDINADGIDDLAFSSEFYDADLNGDFFDEADVGFVGVIFGFRPLTGEVGFNPEDVGTPILAGVRFIGPVANGRAGRRISSAGDFNGDGNSDLLISVPNEIRNVDGTDRPGVVYLIFGGPHLAANTTNNVFNLEDVGTSALPGIVFVSRLQQAADPNAPGPERFAPLQTVAGIGDVDADGFDDIMVGAPTADFVNTASPDQRRLDAGEAYLIYGNDSGTNNPDAW